MSTRRIAQISIHDPEFVDPDCLAEGSMERALAHQGTEILPPWLFQGWRGESRKGRPAWPAPVLAKMLLLRWSRAGMSRNASVEEAKRNTTWRAALCLEMGSATPSERTLRDFERFMRQRHPDVGSSRYLAMHEHIVRFCLAACVVGDRAVWSTDSTPMWCYGAVQDTVRLLGDGLRSLGKVWARATKTSLAAVAEAWGLDLLVAKSTKGIFAIDWQDRDQRASVVTQLAAWVVDVVGRIRRELTSARRRLHKMLLRRCRNLLKVVRDDLTEDEKGRLVVARQVTSGRLVSVHDPQARHGRKSRSKTFNGFKAHVLGDVDSGLIVAAAVTPGNVHDGTPAPRLLRRAQSLCDGIEQLLADTAYGGARLRHVCQREFEVEVLAPPPAVNIPKGKLGRHHMDLDFETWTMTCHAGVATSSWTWAKSPDFPLSVRRFRWPKEACNDCHLRAACCGKKRGGHWVKLHPYERELRAAREDWKRPEVREQYRVRSQCERLVNQVTRHGGRQTRAFGLGAANLQVHLIVMRCNLGLLARKLAEQEGEARAA